MVTDACQPGRSDYERPAMPSDLRCLLEKHAHSPMPPLHRTAEQVAEKLGGPQSPRSRGAAAMLQCLLSSVKDSGHMYLPWHKLQQMTGRLLAEADSDKRMRLAHMGPPPMHEGAEEEGLEDLGQEAAASSSRASKVTPEQLQDWATCLMVRHRGWVL